MNLQTVKKLVTAGFTICIFASLIGIFAGSGNPQLSNYMLIAAVIVLLFTLAIIMKWARCPWCGGSLMRRFFKLRSARTATAIWSRARRKRATAAEEGNKWRVRVKRQTKPNTGGPRRRMLWGCAPRCSSSP